MNFNEYQKLAKRTAKDLNLTEFALGLGGEAGECQEIVKKVVFHGHELDHEKLVKELGDVLWYLALLAETIGVELEEVAKVNIDKLKERYPDGFESEKSINREEKIRIGCFNCKHKHSISKCEDCYVYNYDLGACYKNWEDKYD